MVNISLNHTGRPATKKYKIWRKCHKHEQANPGFPTLCTVPTSPMTSRSTGERTSFLHWMLQHISCSSFILIDYYQQNWSCPARWVYICDRKTHSLITPPYHLTNLVNNEEVELKFTAPGKPGHYNFTVCVRSDSYLGIVGNDSSGYWLNLQVLTWWTTSGWMCKRQGRHQLLTLNGSLRWFYAVISSVTFIQVS